MPTTEHLDIRPAPGFRAAVIARAHELIAAGARFGPLAQPGTSIKLNVYVGCRPGKPSFASLIPIAVLDGTDIWVGTGDPVEEPRS